MESTLTAAAPPTPPTAFAPSANPPAAVQLSARTEGDIIVFFDAPAGSSPDDLIGRIVRVTIDRAEALALHGRMA